MVSRINTILPGDGATDFNENLIEMVCSYIHVFDLIHTVGTGHCQEDTIPLEASICVEAKGNAAAGVRS